jgi:hypothetical protein
MVVLAGACSEKKRTEVVVGLATDLDAPAPLRKVNIQVSRLPDDIIVAGTDASFPISGAVDTVYELPGTYGIYSDVGTADRVRVRLLAVDDAGSTLVVRTAVFSLVPQRTLFVRLGVISACEGKSDCGDGMTCIEGRCASETIDSSRLPDYKPDLVKQLSCASVVTFVDTSTKQPLLPVAETCASGVCSEGVCLSAPAADAGAGGSAGGGVAGGGGAGGAGGQGGAAGAAGPGGAGGASLSRPATLVATYRFAQTFAADQAGVPPLVPVDPTMTSVFESDTVFGAPHAVWAFNGAPSPLTSQGGLTLAAAGLFSPASYSIDMVIELTQRDLAWRRLIDVQNRQSDNGFYVDTSNNLDIYPVSGSTGAFTLGAFHHVVLTVDGSTVIPTVRAYLDGTAQFTSPTAEMNLDGDPTNNPGELMGFFLDNVAGGGAGEWSAGEVALIRVWDGVLTAPQAASLAASPFAR